MASYYDKQLNEVNKLQPVLNFRSTVVPMFLNKMGRAMKKSAGQEIEEAQQELSFLDVKAVYDEAYSFKDKGPQSQERFKFLLAEAIKLDMAYRLQLKKKAGYEQAAPQDNREDTQASHKVA
ncbi:MAG: hypothetical protein AAF549_04380 [Pseudomonadota bacterium]